MEMSQLPQRQNEDKAIESEEIENNQSRNEETEREIEEEIESNLNKQSEKLGVTTYPLKYNLFTFGRIKRDLELYKTQRAYDGTWWGYEHEKSLISNLDDVHYKQKLALCKMLSKLRSEHNAPELHEMMTESEMRDEVKYCFSKTIFGSEIKEVVMAAYKAFIEDRSSAMRSRQKLLVQENLISVM